MLRVNRLRATLADVQAALAREGIQTERTAYASDALRVVAGNPVAREPDGTFTVQDEGSQLVATIAAARPGERVLDLCAAPGGKTTAMAADMRDEGVLVAADVREKRMRLLRQSVKRSGAQHIRVVQVGGRGPLPFGRVFDRLLVDAPCSGLGTIRRDPDIRWRRRPEDLPQLAAAQLQLLVRAADVLAPGGRLVYATCSSEPEENEQVVDALLATGMFDAIDLRREPLPEPVRPLLDDRGMFRTLPFLHGLEAFFAAVLARRPG